MTFSLQNKHISFIDFLISSYRIKGRLNCARSPLEQQSDIGDLNTRLAQLESEIAILKPAVNRLIKRIGARFKTPFPVHAHMLRHGCGYALANAGHDTRALQDWLGHRNIQHTVRYTELSPTRFTDFWRD